MESIDPHAELGAILERIIREDWTGRITRLLGAIGPDRARGVSRIAQLSMVLRLLDGAGIHTPGSWAAAETEAMELVRPLTKGERARLRSVGIICPGCQGMGATDLGRCGQCRGYGKVHPRILAALDAV